jgi:hypothetical protein
MKRNIQAIFQSKMNKLPGKTYKKETCCICWEDIEKESDDVAIAHSCKEEHYCHEQCFDSEKPCSICK